MKRVDEARRAYRQGDPDAAARAHEMNRIAAEEPHEQERGKYLSDAVLGASDGIVTTFAVVAGVTGAALSPTIVLILGLANLLGDGLSMAAGTYLGERSEVDYQQKERERELWEVRHFPEGERAEVREIYRKKGLSGEVLEQVVEAITADEERWVETMMREELEIIEERKDPLRAGLTTFVSFLVGGAIPLVAYILAGLFPALAAHGFWASVVITALAMFTVGSMRSIVIHKPWHRAGLEMLAVGGLAAVAAYGVGYFLRGLAS
ncbi:VIT1/CCC1 transporter family protein [Limnochorda pilosa]|uniref:Membrane protein n=1 Tax=Limnochorda pilosa TaxID=1555112 RepID=A0A0K2SKW2_LIMPI|nr:VIT1/CCC1 transporter family protein [Limnochorda pilosa]BAS27748.1 membrane protein [Limnochorda pilosa]